MWECGFMLAGWYGMKGGKEEGGGRWRDYSERERESVWQRERERMKKGGGKRGREREGKNHLNHRVSHSEG